MPDNDSRHFEFGPFILDVTQRQLFKDGAPVKLSPKTFDLLLFLIENLNQVVTKERLMDAVWHDSFVEEANLPVHISSLRKVLESAAGEDGPLRIDTIPKVGYRFVAGNGRFESEYPNRPHSVEPSSFVRRPNLRNVTVLVVTTVLVAAASLVAVLWYQGSRKVPFRNAHVSKVTSSGDVNDQVISPDGKYVVYSKGGESYLRGKPTLWVRQLSANSELQLLPDYDYVSGLVRFMPDGQSIYFLNRKNGAFDALYREPILGGPPAVLLKPPQNLYFSPDGQRYAYFGNDLKTGVTSINVANADGSDSRVVVSRQAPDYFQNVGPWSPDGKTIMCYGKKAGEAFSQLVLVDPEARTETVIPSRKWDSMTGVSWLPDSSGVVLATNDELSAFQQIWLEYVPSGRTERLTNDTNNYWYATVSADGRSMTAVERTRPAQIWSVPIEPRSFQKENEDPTIDTQNSEMISATKVEGFWGLAAAPNDKVVFTSDESGNTDIWVMNSDGGERRQLTTDQHKDMHPSVCGDGRYIVFTSNRTGAEHVWRMEMDGSDQTQLTFGAVERQPKCSRDGQSVIYTAWPTQKATVWRMSIDGSQATQLTDVASFRPILSPDGTMIAYDFPTAGVQKIGVMSSNGGPPFKVFDWPQIAYEPQGAVKWAPDGSGLVIMGAENAVANLWFQPLDGELRKLTNFTSDGIWNYDFSPDGKRLFVSRGRSISDIVLFSETE